MFSTILPGLFGALAGAWSRFEGRGSKRPWLVTVVLGAISLFLFLWMPPGQEFFAIWAFIFASSTVGALLCGIALRLWSSR